MSAAIMNFSGPPSGFAGPASGSEDFQKVKLVDDDSDGWTTILSAAATSVTFAVPAGGDRVKVYFDVPVAGTVASLAVRPNGLSTNLTASAQIQFAGGGSNAFGAGTALDCCSPNEVDSVQASGFFTLELKAISSRRRRFEAHSVSFTSTTPRTERRHHYEGFWNDATTELTSLQFLASAALGLGVGSRFKIFTEYD